MSRCLAERSIDHVVLERGEVANSWRTERWDSLRLLTPELAEPAARLRLRGRRSRRLPDDARDDRVHRRAMRARSRRRSRPRRRSPRVRAERRRLSLSSTDQRRLALPDGRAREPGRATSPRVPALAAAVPPSIATLTPIEYRNPDQLEEGGVLVVGASATGIQLADEIHRSGRPVTLAVGEHVRVPRTYRGRDIQWWMDAAGVLDERYDEVDDIVSARNAAVAAARRLARAGDARPQRAYRHRRQAGRPTRRHQRRQGAVLRFAAQSVRAGRPQDGAAARHDRRMGDLERARRRGRRRRTASSRRVSKRRRRSAWISRSGEIRTIIWATGFRPDLLVAPRPGVRSQGTDPARRRRRRVARACT